MNDSLDDATARQMVEAAQKMLTLWNRLPAQKQQTLLERFGTRENALAALVTTQLIDNAPAMTK